MGRASSPDGSELERLKRGEAILPVESSWVENIWSCERSRPRRENTATNLSAVALGFDQTATDITPELGLALNMRYGIFETILSGGSLAEAMRDEGRRRRVFAVAAEFSCDLRDYYEARALALMRGESPEKVEETRQELAKQGFDPEAPAVVRKFLEAVEV